MYCVNETLVKREFPDPLKLSNMVPLHKKEDPTNTTNYKFVSVLQLLLKVLYEQLLFVQGNVRTALGILELFTFIQPCKKGLDDSILVGTILSKAYDCLPHNFFMAKHEAYGFDEPSLNLVIDYLIWNIVRDFVTFYSFIRLSMKFNTLFATIKLSIRLLCILHKTLSKPSFKSVCVLNGSTSINHLKSCV